MKNIKRYEYQAVRDILSKCWYVSIIEFYKPSKSYYVRTPLNTRKIHNAWVCKLPFWGIHVVMTLSLLSHTCGIFLHLFGSSLITFKISFYYFPLYIFFRFIAWYFSGKLCKCWWLVLEMQFNSVNKKIVSVFVLFCWLFSFPMSLCSHLCTFHKTASMLGMLGVIYAQMLSLDPREDSCHLWITKGKHPPCEVRRGIQTRDNNCPEQVCVTPVRESAGDPSVGVYQDGGD